MNARDSRPEPLAVAWRHLLGIAATLAVSLALVLAVMYLIWHDTSASRPPRRVAELPPSPRLEPDPADDIERARAREDALLAGYAWVDRAHGVAHVPIRRAMEMLAHEDARKRAAEAQ